MPALFLGGLEHQRLHGLLGPLLLVRVLLLVILVVGPVPLRIDIQRLHAAGASVLGTLLRLRFHQVGVGVALILGLVVPCGGFDNGLVVPLRPLRLGPRVLEGPYEVRHEFVLAVTLRVQELRRLLAELLQIVHPAADFDRDPSGLAYELHALGLVALPHADALEALPEVGVGAGELRVVYQVEVVAVDHALPPFRTSPSLDAAFTEPLLRSWNAW